MLPFAVFLLAIPTHASLPRVDFDRMGKVGLAGAFAGLDLFSNSSIPFDDSVSTLFARACQRLPGPSCILRHRWLDCRLLVRSDNVLYFAGSFSAIGSTSAANIASYTPASDAFAALGSGGPNGPVDALFCDSKNAKVWAGGSFTTPGLHHGTAPPFKGLAGAGGRVFSITSNSLALLSPLSSPFPSLPPPFSSRRPNSDDPNFGDITRILCPAGADGSGNTWFGADGSTSVISINTHTFISASGIRLGNTFQPNHGTTGFFVTTLPDNTVQPLKYLDPTTNQNKTCTNPCPLLTDSSILYQDFLFNDPSSITGSSWGKAQGLHILQLLSSGAFASAVDSENGPSCFAPSASNTTFTGTVQNILISQVNPGASPSSGPTFTWNPYVSGAGQYTMNMLVPGCTELQDCAALFPGNNLDPWDQSTVIYQGPILPTAPRFTTTVHMSMAVAPSGPGINGKFDIVASKIQLILDVSANGTSSGTSGTRTGFGFFEWPLAQTSTIDGTTTLANSTETALDTIGFDISALTSSSSSAIVAVAHHPSSVIFLGGNFSLSSGSASSSGNIVSFKNGGLVTLAGNGLNGPVASLALDGDVLFVAATSSGRLHGVASYNVQTDQWTALAGGVEGSVSSLIAGKFTGILTSSGASGAGAAGLATWDIATSHMSLVVNGTSSGSQFVAGNVLASQNGNDLATITPLGIALEADVSSGKRAVHHHVSRGTAWLTRIKFPSIFARQSSSLAPLPPALPAPAPAVLAGAFWTNTSSSDEVAIVGGIALYDTKSGVSSGLPGAQVNGTVRVLLVVDDVLYVGGEFTISGLNANGFAVYDLSKQQWDPSSIQPLQASSGSNVVDNTIIVAGSFSQAGSLRCQAICSGVQGEVAAVAYAGSNQEFLIASGSLALSDNSAANVAQFTFANGTWASVGSNSEIAGPVTAVEVNAGNVSSIFAAGRFHADFPQGSTLESNTTIAQLAMVPLQDTHAANSIIQSDRMLMISGSLADSSFGNASSVLFDGQSFFPYIVSSSATGAAGAISSLFHSFTTFSFTQHKFLATGVGVVFLLALVGILWTLFSRRDEKINKFDGAEDDDDDSTHHRPSSLLEHINAATRTTIIGAPFGNYSSKEDKQLDSRSHTPEPDPFGPDASNYMQLPISAGSALEILDDRDSAWWYARDANGREGIVPSAYIF
ncbi:cortical protein marker for cell polarity-domain-containing protein [Mycena amicta]|nr:cortical protein marker for cell polarity-domain-containing protein [Mycena amicta]